jgi:hypothetical protein
MAYWLDERAMRARLALRMELEVLRGTATGVRNTVDVSGTRDSVTTRHHALFKIAGTTVMFSSGSPPPISEGDRLVVAGRMKGRLLLADAYLNVTAGVRGDSGMLASAAFFLLMFLAAVAGIILIRLLPDETGAYIVMEVMIGVMGLFGLGYGLYSLQRWLHTRKAVRLVRGGCSITTR